MEISNYRLKRYLSFCIIFLFPLVSTEVPPKLLPSKTEFTLKEGGRFQMFCIVSEGDPPLTFVWNRDGKSLAESSHVVVMRRQDDFTSSITIAAVEGTDQGNYSCIVSNRFGSDSLVTKLQVLVPTSWIRQPNDISTLAEKKLVLYCEASGYPKPVVKWRRTKGFNVGQSSPITESHWKIIDSGTLTTSAAKKEDEGFYTCEVGNGVGDNLSKTVRVEIQVPPNVKLDSTQKMVRNGENSLLVCNITGDKPLNVRWTINGKLPHDNQRIQIFETTLEHHLVSTLNIESTSRDDSGLYVCSANNTFGHSLMSVRLGIVEPPSQPQSFKVTSVWSRSIRVSWLQPYNGNSAITEYILLYKQEKKNHPKEIKIDSSQTSVIIQHLKPYTKYELQVKAENEVGQSKLSETIMVTTSEEEPESSAYDLQIVEKSTSSGHITFKPPAKHHWNGQLLGFYVGYKKTSQGSQVPYSYKHVSVNHEKEIQHCTLNGLHKTSTYTINVIAYNKGGLGPPSEPILLTTTYVESPATPKVNILSTNSDSVDLRIIWKSKRNIPLTGYVVHVKPTNGQWQIVRISLSPNHNYTIGGLTNGIQYQMYLTARNDYGESGPTEVLSFVTSDKKEDAEPLYQQLSFTLPVVLSLVIIFILPIVSCCCMHKLDKPFLNTEGVEARGFTYTAAPPIIRPDIVTAGAGRSLPRAPAQPTQSTYSSLQTYGSEIEYDDPRYDSVVEEMKTFIGANAV